MVLSEIPAIVQALLRQPPVFADMVTNDYIFAAICSNQSLFVKNHCTFACFIVIVE